MESFPIHCSQNQTNRYYQFLTLVNIDEQNDIVEEVDENLCKFYNGH